MFKDNIKNWYEIANKSGEGITRKIDKNFNKHLIKPCQMISIIGPTGSGKTQIILELQINANKPNSFFFILISLLRQLYLLLLI